MSADAGAYSKTGKEAFLLVLHTFFLINRTILSVMVARLDGRIVRDLVSDYTGGVMQLTTRSGVCEWEGILGRTRVVVCASDTEHVHELNGACSHVPHREKMI